MTHDVANIVRGCHRRSRHSRGFRPLQMGANPETGRMRISSVWATAADREASDAAVRDLRRQAVQVAGAQKVKDLQDAVFSDVKQPALA